MATFGIYQQNANKLTKRTLWYGIGFSALVVSVTMITNPVVSDHFSNIFFDGKYNKWLWENSGSTSGAAARQENGLMHFSSKGYNSSAYVRSLRYSGKPLTAPTFIESSFRLEPNQNGGAGIHIHVLTEKDALVLCQIWGMGEAQGIGCQAINFDRPVQDITALNIDPGSWHSARIEVNPSIPMFVFVIDGARVGEYTPRQAENYWSASYDFALWSGCAGDGCTDHSTSRTVQAYFDYVKIGPIR